MKNNIEIWKPITGYEGLYDVSNMGRVRSLNYGKKEGMFKIMKVSLNFGYKIIGLTKNKKQCTCRINRLVAIEFIPNPQNKPTVNHDDGDKLNNCDWNLSWMTQKEQIAHAMERGLMKVHGENQGASIMSESQVIEIRRLAHSGINCGIIAKSMGLKRDAVYQSAVGQNWKYLNKEYPPVSQGPSRKLTEVDVLSIINLCDNGDSQRAVAKKYGISQSVVSRIVTRKAWSHVINKI